MRFFSKKMDAVTKKTYIWEARGETLVFPHAEGLSLEASCRCGQCFRWRPGAGGCWQGIVQGRAVTAKTEGGQLFLAPARPEEGEFWGDYFDLGRDYRALEARMAADARLRPALPAGHGIHIFHQEPFETLISFIISANNNIPRIQGIIERLCARWGEKIGPDAYAFPAPQALASRRESELREIGAGYRAPFILGSARRILEGFDLEHLRQATLEETRRALRTLPGVGPKVADCVALFGLGHMEAFPMDVWMKRAMRQLFFQGAAAPTEKELRHVLSELGTEAGIIQQYIFHYARKNAGNGKGVTPI